MRFSTSGCAESVGRLADAVGAGAVGSFSYVAVRFALSPGGADVSIIRLSVGFHVGAVITLVPIVGVTVAMVAVPIGSGSGGYVCVLV